MTATVSSVVWSKQRGLLAVCALVLAASAGATALMCASMSGGMSMPGNWTMSMAWMRMPGQSWGGSGVSFEIMWLVMMIAMMLPALVPGLAAYAPYDVAPARADRVDGRRAATLTTTVAIGYFAVWAGIGAAIYPLGAAIAAGQMQSAPIARVEPFVVGLALVLAGWVQCSQWKARQLERCRALADCCSVRPASVAAAWRHGVTLGVDCGRCCCALMAAFLALGVMNPTAMILIAVAITAERLAARPALPARAAGVLLVAVGALDLMLDLMQAVSSLQALPI